MFRFLISQLKPVSRGGERSDRVSILVPFLIISAGLGVLAWRSHQLSVRMEKGATTLAIQYAGYAAEITAKRVDAAITSELARVADEWQQIERRTDAPLSASFREWLNANDWMASAIYIPDADPASSVYVAEMHEQPHAELLNREFF